MASQLRWLDGGDIIDASSPSERLAFMVCESFDPMVWGMERSIGLPMESMVATAIQVKVRVNRSPLSRVSAFTYTATQGIAMEAILGHYHDIYYQMVGPKNQMVGPETYQMASSSPPPPEL